MEADRELDARVARAIIVSWGHVPADIVQETDAYGVGELCIDYSGDGVVGRMTILDFSSSAFWAVKREIERRGWNWRCWSKRGVALDQRYTFEIFIIIVEEDEVMRLYLSPKHEIIGYGAAETEELAGCQAFLKAVEVTK